jgi:hypothetical protein
VDLGPLKFDRATRDNAVRVWLDESTRRIKWWTSHTWKFTYLNDAYRRGYNNGYQDSTEDSASGTK